MPWIKVKLDKQSASTPTRVYEPKKALPKGTWTFTLETQTTKALGARDELNEYVQTIRGSIIAEQGRPTFIVKEVGQLELDIVQIKRIRDAGLSLSEICSDHSPQVLHMYEALYDNYAGWRVANSEEFDIGSGSICLIHSVRLDKSWRGNGIGLLAIEGLLRSHVEPNHDVAVLRARASEEAGGILSKTVMEQLASHWSLLGFEPCATRMDDEGAIEDMYLSLSALKDGRLMQAVPHLFPRKRQYEKSSMTWEDSGRSMPVVEPAL